jgi:hypothetical protein
MSTVKAQSDKYVIQNTDKIERLTTKRDPVFNKLWIYPASDVDDNGKLVANDNPIYIGERTEGADVTPDVLATDAAPFPIILPDGEKKKLNEVLIQGTAGDGVWFKWFAIALLCAVTVSGFAQSEGLRAASQSQTDAGTDNNVGVTPLTLARRLGTNAIYTRPDTIGSDLARVRSGQWLVFTPGTYTNSAAVTNLLKRGVNYLGLPGANVLFRQATTNAALWGAFDDRPVGATTNIIRWSGDVTVIGLTNISYYDTNAGGWPFNLAPTPSGFTAVCITNRLTEFDYEFRKVGIGQIATVNGNSQAFFVGHGNGVIKCSETFDPLLGITIDTAPVGGEETFTTTGLIGLHSQIPNLDFYCGRLVGGAASYSWLWSEPSGTHTNNVRVFVGSANAKLYGDSHSYTTTGWFESMDAVVEQNTAGIGVYGGGKFYFTFHGKLHATGGPAVATSSGNATNPVVWVTAQKISSDRGFVNSSTGVIYLNSPDYEDLDLTDTTPGFAIANGGSLFVNGGVMRTNCNGLVISHTGGNALFKNFNGYAVGTNAIWATTNGLSLQSCTFKSGGGTNTINVPSAVTVALYGPVMGNKTNHASVSLSPGTNNFLFDSAL